MYRGREKDINRVLVPFAGRASAHGPHTPIFISPGLMSPAALKSLLMT